MKILCFGNPHIEEDNIAIKVAKQLKEHKIDARAVFIPMHLQPVFNTEEKFPVAERIAAQGLSLPSYVNLKKEDIQRVCDTIKDIIFKKSNEK